MNKQVKKYILNIVILLLVTALSLFFVLKDDAKSVFEALKQANVYYVLACIGLILITYFIEAIILFILARLYKRNYKYIQSFFNFMIGRFFAGITPSASGGQFAQAYTFNKQGVSLTNASSILVMMFITYQIALAIFGLTTLTYSFCSNTLPTGGIDIFGLRLNVFSLSLIGFAITALIVLFIFILSFNKTIHKKMVNFVIKFLVFFRLLKKEKAEEKRVTFNTKIETFRIELKRLLSNVKIMIIVILLYVLILIAYNAIPFYAFKASNVDLGYENFLPSMSYSSFTFMITQMIPIPGSSGSAELFFDLMYRPYLGDNIGLLKSTIIIWRSTSFYFGLIFGGLVLIFYHESPKLQTLHYSDRTLLEIQVIHLNSDCVKDNKDDKTQELINIEDVEEYFAKIKNDLAKNLKANNRSLAKEEKRKKNNDEKN